MDVSLPMDPRQCTAHSKQSGERCKRFAIPGGRVCHYHGGAIPQVKDAARARLRAMVYPALAVYAELLDEVKFPTVRFSTAREIVNHEFGKPGESVSMEHSGEQVFRWKMKDEK